MNLFTSLIIRVVLIITITNVVIFYVMAKRKLAITIPFVVSVILVTLVPLVINIWYDLYRFGIK